MEAGKPRIFVSMFGPQKCVGDGDDNGKDKKDNNVDGGDGLVWHLRIYVWISDISWRC